MKFRRWVLLGWFFMFAAIHRLPAPVEELPDSPTPAPAKRATEKPSPARSKTTESKSKPVIRPSGSVAPQPAGFGGSWTGVINQGVAGTIPVALIINAAGTSVVERSKTATFTHPATAIGNTMTWKAGWLNEITWTLTPNSDGRTAAVTSTSAFGVNGSAVFQRQ